MKITTVLPLIAAFLGALASCVAQASGNMTEAVAPDAPKSAVEQNDLAEVYKIGNGSRNAKAAEKYQRAAAEGDAGAQYNLGLMHATGDGAPMDAVKAAEWYRKAAAQGHVSAQYMLGLMCAAGEGVPKDTSRAVYWYMKAAAQGYASAQYNLGMAYANSEGISRDLVRAYAWFNLAAAQGNKDAEKMRNSLDRNITYPQIAEGQRLASSWKKGDALQ